MNYYEGEKIERHTQDEKERKWLLKKVPKFGDISYTTNVITQFYNGEWRYRKDLSLDEETTRFFKLKKVKLGVGINQEIDIEEIDEIDFYNAMKGTPQSRREIEKIRYTIEYGHLKLEIDQFKSLSLVMMEIENVELKDSIIFPELIEECIIMEVTGNPLFDNYNLGA